MSTIKDDTGAEWTIGRVKTSHMRKFEDATGLSLLNAGNLARAKLGDMLRLAFFICAEQARERQLDFDEFTDRFSGPTIKPLIDEVMARIDDWLPRKGDAPAGKGNPQNR